MSVPALTAFLAQVERKEGHDVGGGGPPSDGSAGPASGLGPESSGQSGAAALTSARLTAAAARKRRRAAATAEAAAASAVIAAPSTSMLANDGGGSGGDQPDSSLGSNEQRQHLRAEIDPAEIVYDEQVDLLGSGVFGRVFKATVRGQTVAVKVPRATQALTAEQLREFRDEVATCRAVSHPNVALFLAASSRPDQLMMVSEFVERGPLSALLSDRDQKIPRALALRMAKDVALGMAWLHDISHIIHRDLKPANLLLDEHMRVKITDFGFAQIRAPGAEQLQQAETAPRGSIMWMAPELLRGHTFSAKIDVYSYALIVYELITRRPLYDNRFQTVRPFVRAVCQDHERPALAPGDVSAELFALITRSWSDDPANRPSFSELVPMVDRCYVAEYLTAGPLVSEAVVKGARAFWASCDAPANQPLPQLVYVASVLRELDRQVVQPTAAAATVAVADLEPIFACEGPDQHNWASNWPMASSSASVGAATGSGGGQREVVFPPIGGGAGEPPASRVTTIQHFATLVRCFGAFFAPPAAAAPVRGPPPRLTVGHGVVTVPTASAVTMAAVASGSDGAAVTFDEGTGRPAKKRARSRSRSRSRSPAAPRSPSASVLLAPFSSALQSDTEFIRALAASADQGLLETTMTTSQAPPGAESPAMERTPPLPAPLPRRAPRGSELDARQLGGVALLRWMRVLAQAQWVHFDASQECAKRRLANRLPRTFLLRLSHTIADSPLTLSVLTDEGLVVHKRVKRQPGVGWLVPVKAHHELVPDLAALPSLKVLALRLPCEKNEILTPY